MASEIQRYIRSLECMKKHPIRSKIVDLMETVLSMLLIPLILLWASWDALFGKEDR